MQEMSASKTNNGTKSNPAKSFNLPGDSADGSGDEDSNKRSPQLKKESS